MGLCRFGQRFSFVEYVVGRSVVKSLVGAFLVEVTQVVGNSLPSLAHRLVRTPVDFFLLEAAPETLHVHVVEPDEMILAPIRVSRYIPLYNDSKLALK